MSRWTKALTRSEWLRLGGFGGAVVFLHLLGWGLFLYYARHNPALAGLGYDWLTGVWRETTDLSVNYLLAAVRR